MSDLEARIDKVTGEFFKKGRCEVCGRSAERTRQIEAATYHLMLKKGRDWSAAPVLHKKCEMFWDEETRTVIGR